MSAFLQVLGVVLAMVAVGTFLMSGFLLAPDARGWRTVHVGWRQLFHAVAVFWLVAALVAMTSPAAVIMPVTIFFAAVFALAGFAVLAWVIKHRPARAQRRVEQ